MYHVSIYVCMCVRVHVCMRVCTLICMYVRTHMYGNACVVKVNSECTHTWIDETIHACSICVCIYVCVYSLFYV